MVAPLAHRVLVVSHTGDFGGAERALLRVVAAADDRFAIDVLTMGDGPFVAAARAQRIDVRVLDGGDTMRATRAEAGRLRGLVANVWGTVRLARSLRHEITERDPDLLVANSLKSAVLLALAAGRRRWVWHLHDRLATDYLPSIAVVALRLLARWGPRRVVANSRATAATAGRLPPGRVRVAYPGIEDDAFDDPKTYPGAGPIGMVGRVSETRGQREFVEAAALVGKSSPDARFRIVGAALFEDAAYAAAITEQIERLGMDSRILQAGWSESVADELRNLGLFVHASPVPEPFGQVIVEAMAVGTPVVATDAGGVPEILAPDREAEDVAPGVRRASGGLLVRPADATALAAAIEWMLAHEEAATAMARAAYDDARRRFTVDRTWSVIAAAWVDALA